VFFEGLAVGQAAKLSQNTFLVGFLTPFKTFSGVFLAFPAFFKILQNRRQ